MTCGEKSSKTNSNFHALQISLKRSFMHGFLWDAEYQWSKGIADGSIGAGEGAVENVSCRACDRSVTPFDVRHNLVTSAIYQLPFGVGRPFLRGGVAGRLPGGLDLSGTGVARAGLAVHRVVTRSAPDNLDGHSPS